MYDTYLKCIDEQVGKNELTFKSDPRYMGILEHVSVQQGAEYLALIQTEFPEVLSTMGIFIHANDSVGAPHKVSYGTLVCSPTSLRYVYHSHLILAHVRRLGLAEVDMVELGAGYGGLCFALHFFAGAFGITLRTYTMIDLPLANKLQERFLRLMPLGDARLSFCSADTFGRDVSGGFLVSNYAFSELPDNLQTKYIASLFPRIQHGFMAWNFIPVYDFGIPLLENVDERPNTGPYNRYLYF